MLLFGLGYWELDRGGPMRRMLEPEATPDFLFPQMTEPEIAPPGWIPGLIDYLDVSFTNATAFSPTDTMPLTADGQDPHDRLNPSPRWSPSGSWSRGQ